MGDGSYGVPVSGGFDMDGDTHNDYALTAMTASPLGRNQAGIVFYYSATALLAAAWILQVKPSCIKDLWCCRRRAYGW
jgi:hypothetical protein